MTKHEAENNVLKASARARKHANNCKECFVPIVDDEGNPKYASEACAKGARILKALNKAEAIYFSIN